MKTVNSAPGENNLRSCFIEAKNHFFHRFQASTPAVDILSRLVARFLITDQNYGDVSDIFLSIVQRLGEWVAGDEKLLHYTGNSGDIRIVRSKPDHVGLWFYELCARLSTGKPYILHFRMHISDPENGVSIKTREIVNQWADIVRRVDSPTERNSATILCMDSYYLTEGGRNDLNAKEAKFTAAIQGTRFKQLFSQLDPKVERPGQWEGMYNTRTQELVVLHDDKSLKGSGNKRKLCLTNAFTREMKKPKKQKIIPGYTLYGKMFNFCDKFNRALEHRTWPHRHGGKYCEGDPGHQDNFAWSCIMQNVFNAYIAINGENQEDYTYKDFFLSLADELFDYAINNL